MNLSQRPGLILFIGLLLGAFVWLIDVLQDREPSAIVAAPATLRHPAGDTIPRTAAVQASESKTGHATLPPLRVRLNAAAAITAEAHEKLVANVRATSVQVNGKEQRVLNARAVIEADYRPEVGPALRKQNGFIIIAAPVRGDENSIVVRDTDRPVLLNPASGGIGIVSGTLIIKLKNLEQAQALGARYSLRLLTENPDISRAYFRVPDGFNLNTDSAKILADPDVEDVEIEILRGKVGFK